MAKSKKGLLRLIILTVCLSMLLQYAGAVSASEGTAKEEDKGDEKYSVTLEKAEYGTMRFEDSEEDRLFFKKGDTIILKADPENGFRLEKVRILDAETEEERMVPEQSGDNRLTFVMPDENIFVRSTFAQIPDKSEVKKEISDTAREIKQSPPAERSLVYAARAGYTSSQLKEKIGKVRVCDDDGDLRKSYNEGMLGVNGTAAYCLDPLVTFKSGDVTPVGLLEYGLSQTDITTCALYIKYAYEYSELTVEQKYLAAQCMIWRYLSHVFGWDCGRTHVDGSDFNLERQNQIYDEIAVKAEEGKKKYIGEGTAYLNDSTQPVAQFSLRPIQGYVRLVKSSGRPELTSNNTCYSLEGAQYGVYEDKSCSRSAAVLTTDAGGTTNTVNLEEGTYYVREIQAPKGYLMDSQIHSVKVDASQTSVLHVTDEPVKDLSAVMIYKIDRGTKSSDAEGAASLENARFRVNFYAGYYTRENLPAKATRSWVLKARTLNSDGSARQVQILEEHEKVSGDPFYKDGDVITLPLGTLSIEEIGPPLGYLLDPVYLPLTNGAVENVEKAEGMYISQVVQEGAKAALRGGNAYAAADSVARGDFALTKIDRNTQTPMEGVRFRLTSNTTGESHTFMTDANGHYSSASDYAAHSCRTNGGNIGDGLWFGINDDGQSAVIDDGKGALPYDTYTLEELKCDANQGKFLYKGTISITKDQYVVNLGNIENADVTIQTTAKDEETGTHYAAADSDVTIIDTVEYTGLQKGKDYRLHAVLINRSTGNPVLNQEKEAVTVSKNFSPKDSNGTVEMEIFFNASGLQGADVVVYEELYLGEEKLAEHKDPNDSSQTIHFPEIATQAVDQETNCEMSKADEEITIADTVSYKNLRAGRKYTVTGILMDKDTKKEALDKNGNKIEAKTEFTAAASEGTVEVIFRFNGKGLGGRTFVAFETLEKDRREYAVHKDISDEAQTIFIPKIVTQVCDEDTKMQISRADADTALIDEVNYENLVPGRTYVLRGTLVNQKTGEEIIDADGNKITAQTTFTPRERKGSEEVIFRFDGSHLAGETIVVYEELLYNDKSVAEHKAIDDKGQTIYFPEIKTNAADKDTELQIAYADQEVTIEDTVHYENLIAGKKYTLQGVLKDKYTGEAVLDAQGKEVTAETEFTAKNTAGEVKVVFKFDGSILADRVTVACEELFAEKKSIAVHADLEDDAQTVRFPDIRTLAADQETGTNMSLASEEVTITDTIAYRHLVTDHPYHLEGVLMDKDTLEPALDADKKEIRADILFTPEESDGTIELTFTFPGKGLEGHTFVIYEELSLKKSWFKEVTVAVHKDIEDEAQSIYFPEIRTSAEGRTGNGTEKGKEIIPQDRVTITDKITYKNLPVGHEYRVEGTIMDKSTGKALLEEGRPVTAEYTFRPEQTSGTVDVDFTVNSKGLAGKELVVFEKLYMTENDKAAAVHEDLEDKEQTVRLVNPHQAVKTGDIPLSLLAVYVILFIISGGIMVRTAVKRK